MASLKRHGVCSPRCTDCTSNHNTRNSRRGRLGACPMRSRARSRKSTRFPSSRRRRSLGRSWPSWLPNQNDLPVCDLAIRRREGSLCNTADQSLIANGRNPYYIVSRHFRMSKLDARTRKVKMRSNGVNYISSEDTLLASVGPDDLYVGKPTISSELVGIAASSTHCLHVLRFQTPSITLFPS